MNKNVISPTGIFSYLYVGRLLNSVMYMVSAETVFSDSDLLLRQFLALAIILIAGLPIAVYVNRMKDKSIIEAADRIRPVWGKITAFIYIAMYLYIGVRAVSRFDLFASSVMFPETDMSFFILILLAICAYNAMAGLRALGRTSAFMAVIFTVVSIIILAVAAKEINFLNLTPFFLDGPGTFIKDSFGTASYTFDLCLIPLFLSRIKGYTKKTFYIWITVVFLFVFAEGFIVVTTLGEFANTQLFPAFSISSIGNIGVFKRLDALETAIWTFGIVLRMSFIIFICSNTFGVIFPKVKKGVSALAFASIIFAASLFVSRRMDRYAFLTEQYQLIFVYIFMVCVLPGLIVLGNRTAQRREKNKKETAS